MPVESLSPLHPHADARGHAHPSPATTAIATDTRENQPSTELLDKVSFNVEMRGLAGRGTLPHEMYHPRLRKSDVTQQAVSHVDTISCWRGISLSQARELALLQPWFHHCLIERIEDCLKQRVVTQVNKRKARIDETNLLPCLIQSFPKDRPCLLHVNLSRLFRDMTNLFCNGHYRDTATTFSWSFGSGDFPRFVYNFLSVQDCFRNTPAGPCAFVNCSFDWFDFPRLAVTADVAWHPPAIEFRHVPTQIRPGAHYVIVPYRERIMEDSQQAGCKQYPNFTEYTVTKSTSKVQWDHRAELFRAQAPERVGIKDAPVSETVIQVTTITRFPGNVRFESTSRYAVRTNLIDTTSNNHSRNALLVAPLPLPRRRSYPLESSVCQPGPDFSPVSLTELMAHRMAPLSSEQRHEEKFAEATEMIAPMSNEYYPGPGVSARSTTKRPNSLSESQTPSPEGNCLHNTDLKRRKLEQTDVTEMGGLFLHRPERAMGIQCLTPPYTPLTSTSNDSDDRAGFANPVGTWASPPRHTRTGFKFSSPLSQWTIQRNYDEFEKMALYKLIDEPCLGDVSFEKIFLHDSEAEDWHSSDLEGLNDEVDDVETKLS